MLKQQVRIVVSLDKKFEAGLCRLLLSNKVECLNVFGFLTLETQFDHLPRDKHDEAFGKWSLEM